MSLIFKKMLTGVIISARMVFDTVVISVFIMLVYPGLNFYYVNRSDYNASEVNLIGFIRFYFILLKHFFKGYMPLKKIRARRYGKP
jgi:hypothetical protein